MPYRSLAAAVALAALMTGHTIQAPLSAQTDVDRQHATWVLDCLVRMQTIKPGMTRADLFRVFREEGGAYTDVSGHYVLRECPYFKVDVVFEPAVVDSSGVSRMDPRDRIKTISRPYIQAAIMN